MNKVLGILGGMGPLASVDLQRRIILHTDASCDAEHLHVITDCNGKIPDRTQAILYGGESPLPEMVGSVRRLEAAGVDFLTIACHTAHYYLPELRKYTSLPFVSIIETSFAEIEKRKARKLCILSTKGTYETRLYEKECEARGLSLISLNQQEKKLLMDIIYGVKAGKMDLHLEEVQELIRKKQEEGAELFLLACTELPLYFRGKDFGADFLDATDVLARNLVLFAGGKLKEQVEEEKKTQSELL